MDRVDVQHIFPVKVSVAIDTMLNSDCDFDRHKHGDVTCEQAFRIGFLFHDTISY